VIIEKSYREVDDMTDLEKSRQFWEKVMGIICMLMVVVAFPILYYATILSAALLPSLESIPFWIVSLLLMGIWYKAFTGMRGELDRRFVKVREQD